MSKITIKDKIYNATSIISRVYNRSVEISLADNGVETQHFKFDNKKPVEVIIHGTVDNAVLDSITVVQGSIARGTVWGDLYINGLIEKFIGNRESIVKKRAWEMRFPEPSDNLMNVQPRVITIEGDLEWLVSLTAQGCFNYYIFGNVNQVECKNNLYLQGDVQNIDAAGMVYSTYTLEEGEVEKVNRLKHEKELERIEQMLIEDMNMDGIEELYESLRK